MNTIRKNYFPIERTLGDKVVDTLIHLKDILFSAPENKTNSDCPARDYRIRQLMIENENLRKKAEEYEKKAIQLSSIIENTTEGIFQTTPEGKYIFANRPLAEIYGYDDPYELMYHFNDIAKQLYVCEDTRNEFKTILEKNDRVIDFESEVKRKDGKTIWIKENARAVRDEAGDITYYEGTVENITARKKAEVELERIYKTNKDLSETVKQFI
jgi:PAS domain S-box-containing protein